MTSDRIEDLNTPQTEIWSVSALKALGTCGHQYYLRYRVPEVKGVPTPYLAFGSAVHKILEALHKEQIWEERIWQRRWNDVWFELASQVEWVGVRKTALDKLGPMMIGDYIDKNRLVNVIETEFPFDFKLGGYPVRGVIDQVREQPDGSIHIVDFKTSKEEPDRLLLRADPQFTIYRHFAQERYPGRDIKVYWYHLRTGRLIYTPRNDGDIDLVIEMLQEGQARVNQKMFARNIGHACNYCVFKKECLGGIAASDEVDDTQI